MTKSIIIILSVFLISLSCNKKIDQSSMFHGRDHVYKKNGIYDAGLNSKKPVSMQIAKEIDKLSKHDDNPKKAAREMNKEMEKKKMAARRKRNKINRKRHIKIETTKGKVGGDK